MNLVPETSVFYDDATNILKATQAFDFEFKVQAIDNMVHNFKVRYFAILVKNWVKETIFDWIGTIKAYDKYTT